MRNPMTTREIAAQDSACNALAAELHNVAVRLSRMRSEGILIDEDTEQHLDGLEDALAFLEERCAQVRTAINALEEARWIHNHPGIVPDKQ